MQNTITNQPTAEAIARDLRQLGFLEGPPAHALEAFAIDRLIYRRLRCAACGHGGASVRAYHRGREYRLVAACKRCGSGQEC